MTKFQLQINTEIGIFLISFDSVEELKKSLDAIDLKKVLTEVSAKFSKLRVVMSRLPKLGFEDIYGFTGGGLAELLVSTGENIDSIGLALFAYDPYPVTSDQISLSSGVTDITVYMNQPQYKKYFTKIHSGYLLSPKGKAWIIEEIIPQLRKEKADAQQAKES